MIEPGWCNDWCRWTSKEHLLICIQGFMLWWESSDNPLDLKKSSFRLAYVGRRKAFAPDDSMFVRTIRRIRRLCCRYDLFHCLFLIECCASFAENGLAMYIWLGSQVSPTFVQSLFGLQAATHIQPEKVALSLSFFTIETASLSQCRIVDLDNPISKNVRALLTHMRDERNCYMKVRVECEENSSLWRCHSLFQLLIIQQRDSIEPFFKNYLIEDKGFTGGASYVDFLYHLHREIRNILQ